MNNFFEDIWQGLTATPKYLQSKYFYDETGDSIFKEIMQCPEYYLTDCELDIFSKQNYELVDSITSYLRNFDVVELGAGDCTKSIYLLDALLQTRVGFTYYPIDISQNVINRLTHLLPTSLPGVQVCGLNGEYFEMLETVKTSSTRNKIVLFLGSSIGNIPFENTVEFFTVLRSHLLPGDLLLTGFDLKKDPQLILSAYNDKAGITKRFNLNLLHRINHTLEANFDLAQFEHRPVYMEDTGTCKSYLESLKSQQVCINKETGIHFEKGEQILMETAQKYTKQQIYDIAVSAGFKPIRNFKDNKGWFIDALWQCK